MSPDSATNEIIRIPSSDHADEIRDYILTIRGKQVMLDRDLARLYGVETRILNYCCPLKVKKREKPVLEADKIRH